ncbi:MAG: zinc-finger domain-containing protein [Pseudomonadota bacterium]
MTVDTQETVVVTTTRVACDGGQGALGHPRVWYSIPAEGYVVCGYCDKCFILKGGPADPNA